MIYDLVVVGSSSGSRVVVCVEAKAGETFGQTVGEYSDAAVALRDASKSTNAPERLDGLLRDWIPTLSPASEEVRRLRYQLFVWTANPNQELSAQVKIAGYLGWEFGSRLGLYAGNAALPSTPRRG